MADIVLEELYQDVKERIDNANILAELPTPMITKVKSKPRVYYAISEAVKMFVADPNVPINSLYGFISRKLYKLQEDTGVGTYNGLKTYAWPQPAFETRPDGALVHLLLDGEVFAPTPIRDQSQVERELLSLQHQAENTLMYGPAHRNAVADLFSHTIYVPEAVEVLAKIIEPPVPVRMATQAYGRGTMTITAAAGSAGNITFGDGTTNVTVALAAGDSEETVAGKAVKAINNDASFKATALLFTDEVRFTTKTKGAVGDASITFTDTDATGVTVDTSPLSLTAAEPVEIPIGVQYQERIAVSAFQQLITNVAQLGNGRERVQEEEEVEG